MVPRILAGLATGLAVAGSATAQQPAATFGKPHTVTARGQFTEVPPPRPQPAPPTPTVSVVPPARTTATPVRTQVPAATAPAASLGRVSDTPRPAPPPAAPAVAPAPAEYAPPASVLYGEGCPPAGCATDCLTCDDCYCGPPGRFWVSPEYLLWTAKGMSVPPLVTTSPPGTSREAAGVLGQPGTSVLFPRSGRTNDDWRSGFRIRAGTWLDECQRFGVEGDFFFLGTSTDSFAASSGPDGTPILARPFVNVTGGADDAQLVSFPGLAAPGVAASELVGFPGVLAGSVDARTRSDFIGGGFNFLCNHSCDPCGRLDYLVGFRYLNLRDEVVINENLTALPGSSVAPGTRFVIQDRFRTTNSFYGANLGLAYERRFGSFFVQARGSVALGVTHHTTDISGSTQIVSPTGVVQRFPGGLLTQPSNIGRYTSNSFAVVPEVGLRVGAQVTERLRATVGYNFLYWSDVKRAGDQIDLGVNTNQIAPSQGLGGGPARPAFPNRTTDYWVQGISFGVEYRF